MNIQLTAALKTASEFRALYKPADLNDFDRSTSLLYQGLKNTSLPDRYEIANFLLDEGCPLGEAGPGGATVLHVLFGHVKHDIDEDVKLARRLIEAGADINAPDKGSRLPFHEVLFMKHTDEELKPIYDIWLERSDADFTTKSAYGLSPIDYAAKVPYRTEIVKRMKQYVEQH